MTLSYLMNTHTRSVKDNIPAYIGQTCIGILTHGCVSALGTASHVNQRGFNLNPVLENTRSAKEENIMYEW